jgi:hypothetical protein
MRLKKISNYKPEVNNDDKSNRIKTNINNNGFMGKYRIEHRGTFDVKIIFQPRKSCLRANLKADGQFGSFNIS